LSKVRVLKVAHNLQRWVPHELEKRRVQQTPRDGGRGASAKAVLEEIERRAREILEEIRAEASQAEEKARRRGFEVGVAEGRAEGARQVLAELQQRQGELDAAITQFESEIVESRERWLQTVVQIATAVAAKIVENEVREDPDAIYRIARSALARAENERRLVLRASAENISKLIKRTGELVAGRYLDLEFKEDPSLGNADVVVEGDHGFVDARLSSRLEEIERVLLEAVSGD